MKSLSARLFAGMTGSFALLLIVFGLIIDASIEFMLIREFDFYLETVVRSLAGGIGSDWRSASLRLVPEALSDIPRVEGELFSQYWTDDGTVLAKSANLGNAGLPRFHGKDGRPQAQSLVLPDGRRARAAGMQVSIWPPGAVPESEKRVTIVVARDTSDLEAHLRQLRWLLLAAGAVTMTAAVMVSIAVIRGSLKPLRCAAEAIAAIKEDSLSARIPAADIPEEIVPVVDRLNELLGRLEDAFARERSLTADIAHELRTPVAGMLSIAGVALNSPRPPAEYREALEDVRQIARRMRSMIEDLLTLARLDSEAPKYKFVPVVLREALDLCWKDFREKADARRLTFENGIQADTRCVTDRNALAMIFAILVQDLMAEAAPT